MYVTKYVKSLKAIMRKCRIGDVYHTSRFVCTISIDGCEHITVLYKI